MLSKIIPSFSIKQWGLLFVYLIPFVPYVYKLISPFFILTGLGSLTILISPTILWIGVVLAKKRFFESICAVDIFFVFLICMGIFLFSIVNSNTTWFFDKYFLDFALYVLPCYYIGLAINYEKDSEVLRVVSNIGIFVMLFWQVCKLLRLVEVNESLSGELGEQMEEAYMLVFPICNLLIYSKKSLSDCVMMMIGFVLILLMGTRGPIIVLGTFIAFYLLFFKKYNKHPLFWKCVIIAAFSVFFVNIKRISLMMIPIAIKLGFSPRVFNSIIDSRFSLEEGSGRDDIYGGIIDYLKSKESLFGLGWGGDRLITYDHVWAHNFELEILVQFGWLLGGLILLLLFILLVKTLFHTKGLKTQRFICVMICVGILELQFSSTYVSHPLLFIMIGCCVSVLRKKKIDIQY